MNSADASSVVVADTEGEGVGDSLGVLDGVGVASMESVGTGSGAGGAAEAIVGGGTTGRMSAGFAGAAAARRWLCSDVALVALAVAGDSSGAAMGWFSLTPLRLPPASELATAK